MKSLVKARKPLFACFCINVTESKYIADSFYLLYNYLEFKIKYFNDGKVIQSDYT